MGQIDDKIKKKAFTLFLPFVFLLGVFEQFKRILDIADKIRYNNFMPRRLAQAGPILEEFKKNGLMQGAQRFTRIVKMYVAGLSKNNSASN